MVVGRVTKFAAVSFVTGTLSLGFAVAVHAADSTVVINQVSSSQVSGSTSSNDSTGSFVTVKTSEKNNTSTNSTSKKTPDAIGADTNEGFSKNSVAASDGALNSTVAVTASSTDSASKTATALTDGVSKGASAGATLVASSGGTGSGLGRLNALSSTDNKTSAAVAVSPDVQAKLRAQQAMPFAYAATIGQSSPAVGQFSLGDSSPVKADAPVPVAPPKNLPIQGALQGLNAVLSMVTLPFLDQSAFLGVNQHHSHNGKIILVMIVIAVAAFVAVGRFVDMLRASGFAHAARADASNIFSSFATPSKSEFFLDLRIQPQTRFFWCQKQSFNVPTLERKGGE